MAVHPPCKLVLLAVLLTISQSTLTTNMCTDLSLASYNSHGLGTGRIEYINQLVADHDFVFLQEHWLFDSQITSTLEGQLNSVCSHGVSGMPSSVLLEGRPFGGCAIVWRKGLSCHVTPVVSNSKRFCAIKVHTHGCNILMINVYMPCDTQNNTVNMAEYDEVLRAVSRVCIESNISEIVMGGDFNTDFKRLQSPHTRSLTAFMQNENLECPQEDRFTYTFESKIDGSRSILDHFLVTCNMLNTVSNYRVLYHGLNMSDHCAISLTLSMCIAQGSTEPIDSSTNPRPRWGIATPEHIAQYKCRLDALLSNVELPAECIACDGVSCEQHVQCIEALYSGIVNACSIAASECIPTSAPNQSHKTTRIAGWNDHVQESKERALFWHALWKCNDSPRHGILADIRRRTRAQYHSALRRLKIQNESKRADRLACSLMNNNITRFWQDVKRLRGASNSSPSVIDGAKGSAAISQIFVEKYKQLYNSVSYNPDEMTPLIDEITEGITTKCCAGKCEQPHVITPGEVNIAIKQLKRGKSDGSTDQTSDHFINGTHKLNVYMSCLLTAMLKHGQSSEAILLSTLIPIPKNRRKSLSSSDNYRAIALGSIVSKIFDGVLMKQSSHVFQTSDLQFGYKQAHSTTHCTFVAMETINYYVQGGSNVFSVLLDASKAFDRVEYVKLFRLLMKKNMCPTLARYLLLSYLSQKLCVKWDGFATDSFHVTNGVKQGGVLSPILFAIYIDELLLRLREAGVGCHIGDTFMGAFGYADDIQLLAPTRKAMKIMLSICEQFSLEYQVMFNPDKSSLLIFGDTGYTCSPFVLNGKIIPRVTTDKHLGNMFGPGLRDQHVTMAVNDLYARTNTLLSMFGKCHYAVKYKLFKSFCMAAYGSQLWDWSCQAVDRFFTAWRKCVRSILGLPRTTHCALLHLLCDDLSVDSQLHKRFLNFFNSCINSDNLCVKLCAKLALHGSRSAACHSLNFVCKKYEICKHSIASEGRGVYVCKFTNIHIGASDDNLYKSSAIKDFITLREHGDSELSTADINTILEYLCVQ